MIYKAIVFLPAMARSSRAARPCSAARPCEIVTACSWAPARPGVGGVLAGRLGPRRHVPVLAGFPRPARRILGAAPRHLTGVMLVVVNTVSRPGARTLDRLHARGPGGRASSPISPVHLRHAGAGGERQLPAAVLGLGGGGARLLPADRFLVPEAGGRAAAIKAFLVNRVGDFGFGSASSAPSPSSAPSASTPYSERRRA